MYQTLCLTESLVFRNRLLFIYSTVSSNFKRTKVHKETFITFTELIENEITNKCWKLLELDGKSVKMADNQEREQFVMFSNEGIVSGFAGCNHFNGFYKLPEMNQISIDEKISSTLKICPDVDVDESAFLKALTMGSRFQLDNERMILLGRDGKKLAVFEVVYF